MKYFWYFVLFIITLATGLWMLILTFWLFYWMCKGIYGLYIMIKPETSYERPIPHIFDRTTEDGLKIAQSHLGSTDTQKPDASKQVNYNEPLEDYGDNVQPLCVDYLEQENLGGDTEPIPEMQADEDLIEYLSRLRTKEISSSPECGLMIMQEFADVPLPDDRHSPRDIVGMDIFEVMGYLDEPDSIEYGDYCETHFFNLYGRHYLVLIVVDDEVTGVCWA